MDPIAIEAIVIGAGMAGATAAAHLSATRCAACSIDSGTYGCAVWPLPGDMDHSCHVRPEARRKLMASSADGTDSAPLDAQPEQLAVAIDRLLQALDIPVTRIEHQWAGLRRFTPDRGLAIGEAAERGYFRMVGQGGFGIQTASAAGRLPGSLVDGTAPDADVATAVPLCDPRRFERAAA